MSEASELRKESRRAAHHSRVERSQELQGPSKSKVNESEEQEENSQLSQSLQSFITEVQTSETTIQKEARDVQESMEICKRQQQNLCELRCSIDQFNLRYNEEMKNREAFTAKYRKSSQMFHALGDDCNAVTDSFHQIVAEQETIQGHLDETKRRSQQMQSSLEEISSVSLPSVIEKLKKQLLGKKEKNLLYSTESQKELDRLANQYELERSIAKEKVARQKAIVEDLDLQIMAENEKAERLQKHLEALSKEKQEERDSLLHRVEVLTEKAASIERDKIIAEKENVVLNSKIESEQNELSQMEERCEILKTDLEQLKAHVNQLSESQSKKKAHNENLAKELDAETSRNEMYEREIEDIRRQLEEVESNTNNRIRELSDESFRVSSNATETESSLQQSLDDERAKEVDLRKEEENLTQTLIQMKELQQHLSKEHNQVLQSNCSLGNSLAIIEREVQDLTEKNKRLNTNLDLGRHTTQIKEQSLMQMRTMYDKSISELQHQLECLEQEWASVGKELEATKLTEQDLLCKIEEAQRDSADISDQRNEHNEKAIKEMQEEISALENDLETINIEFKKEIYEFQQDFNLVSEAVEKRSMELNSINASTQQFQSELDNQEISLKALLEVKENQEECINQLTLKITEYTQELDVKKKEEEKVLAKLEEEKLKNQEADLKMTALQLQYEKLQSDFDKSVADHESEKQVFLRDLVKFEQTSENCSNGIKGLEKQINVWKEKLEIVQTKLNETTSPLGRGGQIANDAEEKMQVLARRLQEWREKELFVEKEVKQAEREASLAKSKVDRLRNKIAAHKAAKKQTESINEDFKVPNQDSIPIKNTTPQAAPTGGDNKENTPQSILKISSKPSTPQDRKRVSFVEDFDDSASSSSSIMLVPELADQIVANPAMMNVIAAQHRERHLAAKRMKMSRMEHASTSQEASTRTITPSKKIFSDEISSSTPENQQSDPYEFGHDIF